MKIIDDEHQILEFENARGMSIIEIDLDTKKDCSECGEFKDFSEFYVCNSAKKKNYLNSKCKQCCSETHKIYYKRNAEAVKAKSYQYNRENPEKRKETINKYLRKNPELLRYWSQRKYARENGISFNMTREQYKKLIAEPLTCFATNQKLSLDEKRNAFVSRLQMRKPYKFENMEVTNKETFYNKLSDHICTLREENE